MDIDLNLTSGNSEEIWIVPDLMYDGADQSLLKQKYQTGGARA